MRRTCALCGYVAAEDGEVEPALAFDDGRGYVKVDRCRDRKACARQQLQPATQAAPTTTPERWVAPDEDEPW